MNSNLNGQIHAVKQMNVQGRQMRQEMQEMKWAEKGQWDTEGQRQAMVQLEGPLEGSWEHRGCRGVE